MYCYYLVDLHAFHARKRAKYWFVDAKKENYTNFLRTATRVLTICFYILYAAPSINIFIK